MIFFSLIIPVYNRPDHIDALLDCLTRQTYSNFETIVVESGSSIKSDQVVKTYEEKLNIRYIFKGNDGQGYSRNRGMQEAKGDYFIILDSDVLMPEHYLQSVYNRLSTDYLDAFGGPDKLQANSSVTQTAVNYCMTSFFTTGGTRGQKASVGKYFPRSFNMGLSREVYNKIGGYNIPFMGEDIEFSHRIINAGFKTGLIEDAYVNHERKGTVSSFYKQIHFFGRARINISKLIPGSFKALHAIPILYCGYILLTILAAIICMPCFLILFIPLALYHTAIFIDALIQYKKISVAAKAKLLTNVLMYAYATGMLKEYYKLYICKKEQSYQL